MKIVAIIQARMGSARLPGKVLVDLEGQSVLGRVVTRVRRASKISEIVVATSDSPADDAVVGECNRLAVKVFRGDENDVLDRYYRAAQFSKAHVVVRITADCPLIDAELTDVTVTRFLEDSPDYASNALVRTYPRGLDTEAFSMVALERAWRDSTEQYQRSHVTAYFYQSPELFKVLSVQGEKDYSGHRWTLDTLQDLKFLRAVYGRFVGREYFGWRDVLALLEREPQLSDLNRDVVQKPLREG